MFNILRLRVCAAQNFAYKTFGFYFDYDCRFLINISVIFRDRKVGLKILWFSLVFDFHYMNFF